MELTRESRAFGPALGIACSHRKAIVSHPCCIALSLNTSLRGISDQYGPVSEYWDRRGERASAQGTQSQNHFGDNGVASRQTCVRRDHAADLLPPGYATGDIWPLDHTHGCPASPALADQGLVPRCALSITVTSSSNLSCRAYLWPPCWHARTVTACCKDLLRRRIFRPLAAHDVTEWCRCSCMHCENLFGGRHGRRGP